MTTATSDLLLPGYWVDEASGAWCSIPWPTDPEEKAALIASSLGPAIIRWSEGRTDEPGLIHYMTGEDWRWTDGQKRFLILWYHVGQDGRFTYRSAVKRGAKGTGKDPMAGAMCNTELVGPVELYDWDDRTGTPIGRPRGFPLVQVMSNSEAQSKDVLRVANAMWSREARDHYELDCGETRTVLTSNGGRFEIPPSSEASGEGDPATFVALNETHHMTETSGGDRVARMARRNVGKSPASIQARAVEFTNAHAPGRDSVAEKSFRAWQHQQAAGYRGKTDILYDSIEAPPETDILTPEGRMSGARAAYADSPWTDLVRICDEMMDARTPVADTIRFYLNGLAAEEDSWVDPNNVDALADASLAGEADPDDWYSIFLDCSKSGDATAATVTRLSDLFTFELGCWEQPIGWDAKHRGPWRAPRAEVDAVVRSAMETYDVAWFGVDPSPAQDDEDDALYWQETIDGWRRDFGEELPIWASPGAQTGDPVRFDMRLSQPGGVRRNVAFTEAAEWLQLQIDGEDGTGGLRAGTTWRHGGTPKLRQHFHNAKRRPNQWGVSLGKITRDSSKHVDLAVCAVGSVMGARIALNSGKLKKKRKRSGAAVFR